MLVCRLTVTCALNHGYPNFSCQRATYVIAGCFADRTWQEITLGGKSNCLNYFVIFIAYTLFTNVVAVHIINPSSSGLEALAVNLVPSGEENIEEKESIIGWVKDRAVRQFIR
jgi:hypothetical protein